MPDPYVNTGESYIADERRKILCAVHQNVVCFCKGIIISFILVHKTHASTLAAWKQILDEPPTKNVAKDSNCFPIFSFEREQEKEA